MLNLLEDAIRRHRSTGILVDANLLLVFLLATWNQKVALEYKRTNAYSEDDLIVLATVLERFEKVIVCASVLAEVSNLAGKLTGARRREFFEYLSVELQSQSFAERTVTVTTVAAASGFVRFGFTDASIEALARAGTPVLTEDFPLYTHLQACGAEAFNFTQVRGLLAL